MWETVSLFILNQLARRLFGEAFEKARNEITGMLAKDPVRRAIEATVSNAKTAFRADLDVTLHLDDAGRAISAELVKDAAFDEAVASLIFLTDPDRERCLEVSEEMLGPLNFGAFETAWNKLVNSVDFSVAGSAELGHLIARRRERAILSDGPARGDGTLQFEEPAPLANPRETTAASRAALRRGHPGIRHGVSGGTVRLGSAFYLVRKADYRMEAALRHRRACTLVIQGMRQSGKSSLLARAIALARSAGHRVFYFDFQTLTERQLDSLEVLLKVLARRLERDLGTTIRLEDIWDELLGETQCFGEFLEMAVLKEMDAPVLIAFDEVDRLFNRPYRGDFFNAVRVWHNQRAHFGPWEKLSLAITHGTDPSLWIEDLNQSPFNVGEQLQLGAFSLEEMKEMNRRYGSPLDSKEIEGLKHLVGGQPYLVCRALWEVVTDGLSFDALRASALEAKGAFGRHLRERAEGLERSERLRAVVRQLVRRDACESEEDFQTLRAAGLVVGRQRSQARLSCDLYRTYFERHL